MANLFDEEFEQEAIESIKKFAKIADKLGFDIAVGFSGGKDSQVIYDLCKRAGIAFKAYYNVSFESNVTKKFIRENYPEVIWRKDHRYGYIENIAKNHSGMLPTQFSAYCCEDYKHNRKYADACVILGVRKAESQRRATRTAFFYKNKTLKKKLKVDVSERFLDKCQSIGGGSKIQLLPIVDWGEKDVWRYLKKYDLPINPEYEHQHRVGCLVCPKANFTRNYNALLTYPKLIDAFIKAKSTAKKCNWVITGDGRDYSDDKLYYICRWLNHSFMPFTPKQQKLFEKVKENYLQKKLQNKK